MSSNEEKQEAGLDALIASMNAIREELRELRVLVSQSAQMNIQLGTLIELLSEARATVRQQEQAEQEFAEEANCLQPKTTLSKRRTPDKIIEFLSLRGVKIVGSGYHSGVDFKYEFAELPRRLGDNYAVLAPLLTQLKSKTATGERFALSIKELDQKQVTFTCSIVNNMNTLGLLGFYQYHKSPKCIIEAAPARTSEAINFINGQWLEQYVCLSFQQVALQTGLPFSFMQSVQIEFDNGERHELDFIAEIAGHILWIECKSGEYKQHIDGYMKMQRLFWLPKEQTWLILADAKLADKAKRMELEKAVSLRLVTISETSEALGKFVSVHKQVESSV